LSAYKHSYEISTWMGESKAAGLFRTRTDVTLMADMGEV